MHKPPCISATCDVLPVLLADRQRRAYVTPPSARRAPRRPSKVPRWKITRRAGRSFANGCRFLRTSGRRLIRQPSLRRRQSSRTNFSQVGVTRTKEWWAGYCHGPADDDWRSIFERGNRLQRPSSFVPSNPPSDPGARCLYSNVERR